MIQVKDLTISFNGTPIVENVNLAVEKGTTLALLGKNGSGKSIILKAVAGLIDYGGSIEVQGRNIRELYEDGAMQITDAPFHLTYVFQKGGLFDSLTVFENTAFGLRRMGLAEEEIAERALGSLARVGLKGSEEKLPSELSGGMQKRVGLARAVCMNPNVILYDDPTAGLDPILSDSIADLILEIRNNLKTTSIVATHDLQVAMKIADRAALIYGGRIVYESTEQEFFETDDTYARQFIEGEIEGPIDIY